VVRDRDRLLRRGASAPRDRADRGATAPGQFHFSVKEPLGTVASLLPFNYPLVLLCWKTAAALAAGNAVIVKPHEQTSLTTLKFMEVFAGLPPGLMQVVTGGARVGQRLAASQGTHGIAFTGSVAIGQAVARTCAESFQPCLIEASGNDPFIVMPSAPLDVAARGAAFAAYLNCGQVCTSAERFYVHDASTTPSSRGWSPRRASCGSGTTWTRSTWGRWPRAGSASATRA
jgi:acyl-CoA reductase-like NAD-dependent aldehyde dehydrogenase